MAEILKTDPTDFGGLQQVQLDEDACRVRLCCAAMCSRPGYTQMVVGFSPMVYRIVCREHVVMSHMLVLSALGDSVPSVDISGMARALGVNLRDILSTEPEVVSLPDRWRCFNCGNGLVFEPSLDVSLRGGSGGAWFHMCGVDGLHGR